MKERVFIVGLKSQENESTFEESMDELWALAESAGAEVVSRIDQASQPNARTYIGSGKIEEIRELADNMEIDSVIINGELSGSQIKKLESAIGKKILDRTNLILDIFATRARTNESVLQVSLAQAQYMLPRLEGYRDHLSRTGGGIGTRGPGEQQLETDRRHIRNQIARIKKKLKEVEKNRQVTSKRRNDGQIAKVSLIGYTNVGKSTIMNQIIDLSDKDQESKVYADDRLFATLQTSHRSIDYGGNKFILADTVGLIEDLPINLIEAFKSTLEEASYSDLLLIVIDASTDNVSRQLSSINNLIEDLQIGEIDKVIVYNKIDLCDEPIDLNRGELASDSIQISAKNDDDIIRLLETIVDKLKANKHKMKLLIPYKDYSIYSKLLDQYPANSNNPVDEGMVLEIEVDNSWVDKLKKYEVD